MSDREELKAMLWQALHASYTDIIEDMSEWEHQPQNGWFLYTGILDPDKLAAAVSRYYSDLEHIAWLRKAAAEAQARDGVKLTDMTREEKRVAMFRKGDA